MYNRGMKRYTKMPWTEKERHLLRDYYYPLGIEQVAKLLPGRSVNSIVKQVSYLKKRGWYFKNEEKR